MADLRTALVDRARTYADACSRTLAEPLPDGRGAAAARKHQAAERARNARALSAHSTALGLLIAVEMLDGMEVERCSE